MPLAILGLGNLLLTDDGVGIHALRALAADPPPGAILCEVGTAVFDALSVLERSTRVIAIDAIDAGQPPGTVVRFELDADDAPPTPPSLHDLDLPALVRSLPEAGRPAILMVGIQPDVISLGTSLSPVVSASLPALLREVRALALSQERRARSSFDDSAEAGRPREGEGEVLRRGRHRR
jgi:hydrogenase maturation protease